MVTIGTIAHTTIRTCGQADTSGVTAAVLAGNNMAAVAAGLIAIDPIAIAMTRSSTGLLIALVANCIIAIGVSMLTLGYIVGILFTAVFTLAHAFLKVVAQRLNDLNYAVVTATLTGSDLRTGGSTGGRDVHFKLAHVMAQGVAIGVAALGAGFGRVTIGIYPIMFAIVGIRCATGTLAVLAILVVTSCGNLLCGSADRRATLTGHSDRFGACCTAGSRCGDFLIGLLFVFRVITGLLILAGRASSLAAVPSAEGMFALIQQFGTATAGMPVIGTIGGPLSAGRVLMVIAAFVAAAFASSRAGVEGKGNLAAILIGNIRRDLNYKLIASC